MDKSIRIILAFCGALLMAPAAATRHNPALDETLSIPDFTLVPPFIGGQPVVFTLPAGIATQGDVVGISFGGTVDVEDDEHDHTWVSDTCMIVQAPDGSRFTVGGRYVLPTCYPNGPLGPVGPPGSFENGVRPWDFQRTAADGSYQSTHHDAFAAAADAGNWTFTFMHDHHHEIVVGMGWSDVTITLHKTDQPFQPGPGVLALLRDRDLGYAQVGKTTRPTRTNRILNTAGGGGSPIELASIEIVGDPEIQEAGRSCSVGDSLVQGEPPNSCLLEFNCAPTAAGLFEADYVVTTTDGQQDSAHLTCTGFDQPPLAITPSRHNFGRIDPSGNASFDFSVTNNSGIDMFLYARGRTPPEQFSFDIFNPEVCFPVAPGATCTLPVTFAPNGDQGSWTTTLLPWFFAETPLGVIHELPIDVSGGTIGAKRLFALALPPILWPPNGGMRPVRVLGITLPWHPRPDCAISNVGSNEGLAADDFEITGDLTLKLRAKHLRGREGRIYSVEVTCSSGDEQHVGVTQVRVPNYRPDER